MKAKIRLLLALIVAVNCPTLVLARGASQSQSVPTFNDEGNQALPFKVTVGTQTPVVQPYIKDTKLVRAIMIQNPSPTYDLMVGTWSLFTDSDAFFFVNKGSGTLSLSNNTTFYFKYGNGGSSQTVRGVLLQQLKDE